jgi:hypothetical protein
MKMNMYGTHDDSSSTEPSKLQMTIGAQLIRTITSMRQVDELFQWLAHMIVQHFDVQFIQFWTNQTNSSGQFAVQLRTMVSQDPSVPQQIVVNDHIASIAQRIVSERLTYHSQPVENVFSHYQTILLKRYGLLYCAGCFTSSDSLLPQNSQTLSREGHAIPLAMTTLLFLRKYPHRNFVPAINAILEQAVVVAGNRGLLLHAAKASQRPISQVSPQQESLPPLGGLIPRRKQEASLMLSSNPFAGSAIIADKQARRLYTAIDGRTSVADLSDATGINLKEIYTALQTLLEQRRIELSVPGGREVDASLFLDNR